jgi:class I fructose-bisphosphate aldolase
MFGRRIFRAEQPAGVLRALNAVIHENQSVEQALRVLDQESRQRE